MATHLLRPETDPTPRRQWKVKPPPAAEQASYPDAATLTTMHDTVPNFALNANILAVQSGNWSSTSTWSLGRVPEAGDIVGIPTTLTVVMDNDTTTEFEAVGVAGTLQFITDADTQLWTQHLLVYGPETLGTSNYGHLQIGTEASPVENGVTAEIVFTDVAIDTGTVESPGVDPAQYGNGLIAFGEVVMHGEIKTPYRRLAGSASAAATSLTLNTAPSNWTIGDEVVIASSRLQIDPATWSTAHPRFRTTIASLSDVTLGIDDGLDNDRPQAVDGSGTPQAGMTAHVGNLTRNVIIRSENPAGTRGHVFFTYNAEADIRYVRFKGLSRTTGAVLDSTTFDGGGNPTHIGTNQVGRYAAHFHQMGGGEANRFRIEGCSFDPGTDGDHTRKWAIAVHGSNYGSITFNLMWNWVGAGVAIEDGDEHHNTIDDNVVIYVSGGEGAGSRADTGFPGREGDGFWAQTERNYYRRNVAANCALHGYTFFNDGGLSNYGVGGYLDFGNGSGNGNETYGGRNGLTHWYINGADTLGADPSQPMTYMDNFKIWHCWEYGYGIGYPTFNVTFRNWIIRLGTNTTRTGKGIWGGDYQHRNVHLVDCDIQNCTYGIEPPLTDDADNVFTVTGGTLHNTHNILVPTQNNAGSGGWIPQDRVTTITDVDMTYFAGGSDVNMSYNATTYAKTRLRNIEDIRIFNYNGTTDDYRIWFNEQAEAFEMPISTDGSGTPEDRDGCPEAGLTNAQAYAKYHQDGTLKSPPGSTADAEGCCIAGALMPAGATTETWVTGGKVTTL